MYAPIIVFAFNRPEHLRQTLNALAKNEIAKESDLYIFIDGPKNESGRSVNCEVEVVAEKYSKGCFQTVHIKNNKKNMGLAHSVIEGVSQIINSFEKVIVTEDDAVAAPGYLKFMNEALEFYQEDNTIWSIGGYTIPLSLSENYAADIILTQRSSSYAWATWKDRWNKIDWEVKDYKKFRWNFKERSKFNAWGNDRASMLDDQMLGRVNSWAIRFDYAMFKNNMYNILPVKSLIANIGHDGSGTHNKATNKANNPFEVELAQEEATFQLRKTRIDENVRKEFCKPFQIKKINLAKRYIGNFIRSIRKGERAV